MLSKQILDVIQSARLALLDMLAVNNPHHFKEEDARGALSRMTLMRGSMGYVDTVVGRIDTLIQGESEFEDIDSPDWALDPKLNMIRALVWTTKMSDSHQSIVSQTSGPLYYALIIHKSDTEFQLMPSRQTRGQDLTFPDLSSAKLFAESLYRDRVRQLLFSDRSLTLT